MTFQGLAGEVLEIVRGGVHDPLSDDLFNDLALRVFRFQCQANPAYGGFVRRRGLEYEAVERWEEIPCLPTRAFKAAALVSGGGVAPERVFQTSGTTLGREQRGEHHVPDLSLYRANLLPNFRAHLMKEGEGKLPLLCLLPSPAIAPRSSLSFMMGEVLEEMGDEGSGFFAGPDAGIDMEGLHRSLGQAREAGAPVAVVGTAFAFVGLLEAMRAKGLQIHLPEGSRIMETGGYKGLSREVPRVELYEGLVRALGVQENHIVNEYGMTELLSQFYEPVLPGSAGAKNRGEGEVSVGLAGRYHRGPPWVRTRVLDPMTLGALPDGRMGVLAHLDLCNLGSVVAVLTEDLGRQVRNGFHFLGRGLGSEPRGCSLAMEDFLASGAVS